MLQSLLRHTRLLSRDALWTLPHPLHSLVHLLKRIITLRFELAHRTVIGVDRDLFFVVRIEQGRMLLHDLNLVSYQKSRWSRGCPCQARKRFHRSLLIETVHLIIRKLKAKIAGQPQENIRVRLEGGHKTRGRSMAHKLRDIRQYFPIHRLVAATMRRAQEDQTQRRILDRLVQWLQSCLE